MSNPEPTDATITEDTACVVCGYNLRTLSPDLNCPECRTLVQRSLMGEKLVYSNQRWLHRVRLGLYLITLGLVGLVVLSVMPFTETLGIFPGDALLLIATISSIFLIGGTFNFTTREMRQSTRHNESWSRHLLRILVLVSVALLITYTVSTTSPLLTRAAGFSFLATMVVSLRYAQWLTARSIYPALQHAAQILYWALLLILILLLAVSPIELAAGHSELSGGPLAIISMVAGCLLVV